MAFENFYAVLETLPGVKGESIANTQEEDDYSVGDAEVIVSEEEDEDFERDCETYQAEFDLLKMEEAQNWKPVFTNDMFQRMAAEIAFISSEQDKTMPDRTCNSLYHQNSDGQSIKIWQAVENANSITLHYSTRVEMTPSFQTRFGPIWDRTRSLHSLNPSLTFDQLSKAMPPYHLRSYRRAYDTTHLDSARMNRIRARLQHTKRLWITSASRRQIYSLVCSAAAKLSNPITKIVCIGLGSIRPNPEWYQGVLQHMTVFTLAAALNAVNRSKNVKCPKVRIIAQDPCYEAYDQVLLQEMSPNQIDFSLSDPEALLAIDANTIVVTAYLPNTVPLMQIMADLFVDKWEKGPAMILCDRMEDLRKERRWYPQADRNSPAVARMLLDGYRSCHERFVGLEKEFEKDVRKGQVKWHYWLEDMDFWLRKT